MLFEQCPEKYRARYVDGVVSEPSLAMLFGHTVHTALEVLLQGQGGCCPVCAARNVDHDASAASDGAMRLKLDCARAVYYREFDTMRSILADEGVEAGGLLYLEGLRMIDQVDALRLNDDSKSSPERWFKIPTQWGAPRLSWPVVGAVDLWSPPWSKHGAIIWDFKTTVGSWSQTRADKERWQPLLYSWAYVRAFDVVPTFRYLVLNRVTGVVDTFERSWPTKSAFADDLNDLEFHAEEIAESVAEGNFTCTRGHGSCLECGEPYGHDHVCKTPKRATVKLTGKLVAAS